MLRMSPLRGDQSVATPATPGRFATRFVANTASPSPLARASALGGLLFADSVRYACQGLAGPGPALVPSSTDINKL